MVVGDGCDDVDAAAVVPLEVDGHFPFVEDECSSEDDFSIGLDHVESATVTVAKAVYDCVTKSLVKSNGEFLAMKGRSVTDSLVKMPMFKTKKKVKSVWISTVVQVSIITFEILKT